MWHVYAFTQIVPTSKEIGIYKDRGERKEAVVSEQPSTFTSPAQARIVAGARSQTTAEIP